MRLHILNIAPELVRYGFKRGLLSMRKAPVAAFPICLECGQFYERKHAKQEYCSKACGEKNRRRKSTEKYKAKSEMKNRETINKVKAILEASESPMTIQQIAAAVNCDKAKSLSLVMQWCQDFMFTGGKWSLRDPKKGLK